MGVYLSLQSQIQLRASRILINSLWKYGQKRPVLEIDPRPSDYESVTLHKRHGARSHMKRTWHLRIDHFIIITFCIVYIFLFFKACLSPHFPSREPTARTCNWQRARSRALIVTPHSSMQLNLCHSQGKTQSGYNSTCICSTYGIKCNKLWRVCVIVLYRLYEYVFKLSRRLN